MLDAVTAIGRDGVFNYLMIHTSVVDDNLVSHVASWPKVTCLEFNSAYGSHGKFGITSSEWPKSLRNLTHLGEYIWVIFLMSRIFRHIGESPTKLLTLTKYFENAYAGARSQPHRG